MIDPEPWVVVGGGGRSSGDIKGGCSGLLVDCRSGGSGGGQW